MRWIAAAHLWKPGRTFVNCLENQLKTKSPSKKTSSNKSVSHEQSPALKSESIFKKEQLGSMVVIAKQAGLTDANEALFADWLAWIEKIAPNLEAFNEILTLRQQRTCLERVSNPIGRAIAVVNNGCPENYLRHYHMRHRLFEIKQSGEPLTNEVAHGIKNEFDRDLETIKRWKAILEFGIECTLRVPPNSDEIGKSNRARRAHEDWLLEHIFENWSERFRCRTATSKSSLLVKFCVQLFKALGLLRECDEHDDQLEAMRKRLSIIAKSVTQTSARRSPRAVSARRENPGHYV